MKKIVLLFILSNISIQYTDAQIICIYCYNQNDTISPGVNNLVTNGGFENTPCGFNSNYYTFCPNSTYYSCDIQNWTCTGGGPDTYSCFYTNAIFFVLYGQRSPYFGNYYCKACSGLQNDTSCLVKSGDCEVTGLPPGYPTNTANYGGSTGLSLSQTVNGLTPGNIYVLEFWAGGEAYSPGSYPDYGLFAVDVGFGNTFLRCKPTYRIGTIGTRFIIEFRATSSSHTIKFTNWGHICATCTELILDDVRLYTLAQLSPSVPSCISGGLPHSDFVSSDTIFCEESGKCIDFLDQSTNNPTAWKWSFPGAIPDTSTQQNPTNICYYTPGTYSVTLITSNSNGSDTLTVSPMITFATSAAPPVITLSNDTLYCSHAASYQWYFNGSPIPLATDSFYKVTVNGIYSVQITDENGCTRLSSGFTVSVNELSALSGLKIYPTLVTASFTLQFNTQLKDAEVFIYDMLGKEMMRKRMNGDRIEIAKGNLAGGVYFVKVITEEKQFVQKIIVE